MQPVKEELRRFMMDNFVFDETVELSDTDSFLDHGIVDSTGVLEIISFLERQYGIVLEDGELVPENLDSISNISDMVWRKLNPRNVGGVAGAA